LFEGTPDEMYASLNKTLGNLPPQTKIYFGHEYTRANLEFALSLEPGNQAVKEKLATIKGQGVTTPSTLEAERLTNPFFRHDSSEIQAIVKQKEPDNDLAPASIFRVIRALKDRF
jgi:hydroxyacylglutathione hydrolase